MAYLGRMITEALETILSGMEVGQRFAFESKAEIKERIYSILGVYPSTAQLDGAILELTQPVNKYKFGYITGIGWYRSATGLPFIKTNSKLAKKCRKKIEAIAFTN